MCFYLSIRLTEVDGRCGAPHSVGKSNAVEGSRDGGRLSADLTVGYRDPAWLRAPWAVQFIPVLRPAPGHGGGPLPKCGTTTPAHATASPAARRCARA